MGEVEDYRVTIVPASILPDVMGRSSTGSWLVGTNTGTGFVNETWGAWNEAAGWHDVMKGDFNGDGQDDMVGRDNTGRWQVAEYGSRVHQSNLGAVGFRRDLGRLENR